MSNDANDQRETDQIWKVGFTPLHLDAMKQIGCIIGTPDDEAWILHYAIILARDILEDIDQGNYVLVENRRTGRTEQITI